MKFTIHFVCEGDVGLKPTEKEGVDVPQQAESTLTEDDSACNEEERDCKATAEGPAPERSVVGKKRKREKCMSVIKKLKVSVREIPGRNVGQICMSPINKHSFILIDLNVLVTFCLSCSRLQEREQKCHRTNIYSHKLKHSDGFILYWCQLFHFFVHHSTVIVFMLTQTVDAAQFVACRVVSS